MLPFVAVDRPFYDGDGLGVVMKRNISGEADTLSLC
jgi:hypothetical protein